MISDGISGGRIVDAMCVSRDLCVGLDSKIGPGVHHPVGIVDLFCGVRSPHCNTSSVNLGIVKLLLTAIAALNLMAEGPVPDFSGNWKQSNELSSPKRSGNVTLKIRHREPELVVETTSSGVSARHAVQRYTTDRAEP